MRAPWRLLVLLCLLAAAPGAYSKKGKKSKSPKLIPTDAALAAGRLGITHASSGGAAQARRFLPRGNGKKAEKVPYNVQPKEDVPLKADLVPSKKKKEKKVPWEKRSLKAQQVALPYVVNARDPSAPLRGVVPPHQPRFVAKKGVDAGVLFWAHGGSATGTLEASLARTASQTRPVLECNGRRQGFDTGMVRCALGARAHKALFFTHVQPSFLKAYGAGVATSAPELFKLAREVGVKLVIAVYRRNALASMVSTFRLQMAAEVIQAGSKVWKLRANETFGSGLVPKLNQYLDEYKNGLLAAKRTGMTVMEFRFKDVVFNLCSSVLKIIAKLKTQGALQKGLRHECEREVRNHQPDPVRVAMGYTMNTTDFANVFDAVEEQLSFTTFEWMRQLEVFGQRPSKMDKFRDVRDSQHGFIP